jgi:hypothetical protein
MSVRASIAYPKIAGETYSEHGSGTLGTDQLLNLRKDGTCSRLMRIPDTLARCSEL